MPCPSGVTGSCKWTSTYDSMDRLQTRTDPLAARVSGHQETYTWDQAGNPASFTDRRGKKTAYSYDAVGRLKLTGYGAVTSNKGVTTYESTTCFGWDDASRLTGASDGTNDTCAPASGNLVETFDDLDRLTQETQVNGTVSYGYLANTALRNRMSVAGQPDVTYTYDPQERVRTISRGGRTVSLSYDDANRPTQTTLPNGISQSYAYDPGSNLQAITYARASQVLGDLNYAYDGDNRRTAIWSTQGSLARTGLPAAFASATYNANNQLTARVGSTYAYDAAGNLTSDGNVTYTWNARGQLGSQVPGRGKPGATASYTYDALGRRTQKTINSTATGFLFDGANVIQEQGAVQANLLTGLGVDETFERSAGGTVSDLETDALGSTLALTDGTSGATQISYTYDPFGVVSASGGASTNAFQFTGRESDGAAGFQYNRARYYAPGLQRWISEDPIGFAGGDVNLYGYGAEDPVDFTDPSGLHNRVEEGGAGLKGAYGAEPPTGAGPGGVGPPELPSGMRPGSAGGPGAGKRFTDSVRELILRRNGGRCVYCNRPAEQADHIVPRSKGGNNTLENGQPTCAWCNPSKRARPYPKNPPPGYTGPWYWGSGVILPLPVLAGGFGDNGPC